MDAKIAGFYTCYDAYFCKIFTYLCKSSLERRFMKKIMNEKLTITTSNPVRARFYEYPRFTYPWHFHSEYEIIYVEKGEGDCLVGDSIISYSKGDLILFGSELPHSMQSPPDGGEESDNEEKTEPKVRGVNIQFVHSVGINMVVGYGLTESTATVSCTLPVGYDIGSVGVVLPGIEVKIGEDNEILLRGKTITKGYYKKAEATAAAIEPDGWFHTGDAGYFKNGQLFLTERIKDLFKTSNGKYVAPQALETKLVIDRYIDQIAIIADQRKFVSALIVPVYGFVKEYAEEKGIKYKDMEELLKHPKIVGLFRARIDTLQQQFAHYEQIKRFTLLPEPFSMER